MLLQICCVFCFLRIDDNNQGDGKAGGNFKVDIKIKDLFKIKPVFDPLTEDKVIRLFQGMILFKNPLVHLMETIFGNQFPHFVYMQAICGFNGLSEFKVVFDKVDIRLGFGRPADNRLEIGDIGDFPFEHRHQSQGGYSCSRPFGIAVEEKGVSLHGVPRKFFGRSSPYGQQRRLKPFLPKLRILVQIAGGAIAANVPFC